jgi:uncharacterized damage-inducible protein DinB
MGQVKWFDRQFDFKSSQNTFLSIFERLVGTPARLEEKFKTIPVRSITLKINGTWSIKENVGHLIDLEPLWQGRLDDIISGQTTLRPTDLQNTKTDNANHNERHIDELLQSFRQIRQTTIKLLEKIDDAVIYKAALHPRLKTPMRTIDLFLFVAEHDDHHLARISELIKMISNPE